MEIKISLQWPGGGERGFNWSRAGLKRDSGVETEAYGELASDQEESGSISSD